MTTEQEELAQETPQNSGIELELEASNQENDENGRTCTKKLE